MAKHFVLNSINDFLYKTYGIIAKITEIDNNHQLFDLGNNCAFILNINAFKTQFDISKFTLDLSSRINTRLLN